jgi:hypothetical protein
MSKVAGPPFCVYTSFRLPLWYLVAIVLSVILRFTASDYHFGILWPLYCLSFYDLRLLITSLVSCGHCIACPSTIYGFWLPLWYLQTFLTSYICISPLLHCFLLSSSSIYRLDYFGLFHDYIIVLCFIYIIITIIFIYYLFSVRILLPSKTLIKGRGDGFLLTSLIPPHVCVYPNP